jgi:hypothetical protein
MDTDTTRRAFLRSACRCGALLGLGGWVTYAALHSDGRPTSSLCARCPSRRGCTRPEGTTARLERREAPDSRPMQDTGSCGLSPTGDDA